MPQLQTLVLTDRKATPVDHTFTPRDIVGGVGTVVESATYPIGENTVTVSMQRRTSDGRYTGTIRGTFPIVQTKTENGISVPVVVRTARASLEFVFDKTSSEAERADVVGMIQSALAADRTLINDTIVKLQGVY